MSAEEFQGGEGGPFGIQGCTTQRTEPVQRERGSSSGVQEGQQGLRLEQRSGRAG